MTNKGRLPNLLIIGAMKCGTTSLHAYLNQHPEVFMSDPKEIHYYADTNYRRIKKEEYTGFFQTDKPIVGTSPQSYTKCHHKDYMGIPEKIYKDTPDVKLIYILRDPLERYKSHVLESYHCDPPSDVEYSKQIDNYTKTGMYGMQLEEYSQYFPMKNIHILTLEDLVKNRLSTMNRICKFLNIQEFSSESRLTFKKNAAETKRVPQIVKRKLWFRILQKVDKEIANKVGNKLAYSLYENQMIKPDLSEAEMSRLRAVYREDKKVLERLSGVKFNQWSL